MIGPPENNQRTRPADFAVSTALNPVSFQLQCITPDAAASVYSRPDKRSTVFKKSIVAFFGLLEGFRISDEIAGSASAITCRRIIRAPMVFKPYVKNHSKKDIETSQIHGFLQCVTTYGRCVLEIYGSTKNGAGNFPGNVQYCGQQLKHPH
jgi:hypothetical protein